MPYSSVSEVPDYVPKDKRKQWLEVFNSAYARTKGDAKEKERVAFAEANSVAGPSSKIAKGVDTHYGPSTGIDQCQFCSYYSAGVCSNAKVSKDDNVPENAEGQKVVSPSGWCDQYEHVVKEAVAKSMIEKKKLVFIPFIKVDAAKREVWGVVTAEIPDKEDEVCDYAGTKPYYEALIAEMTKATDGGNYCPLREMHQPSAVGKGIGYEFRDNDREIFFGYKVVDDVAWRKVEEKVYTGFSHGGVKIGEDVPDPVFKGCMRYIAKPSEVSLVDNPCLGVAHFTYVSKTGEIELRKNRSMDDNQPLRDLRKTVIELTVKVEKLSAEQFFKLNKNDDVKTKKVAGEELPASAFLIVGDAAKTETWHLPVKFTDPAKTKRHIKNALARINQVKGITDAERGEAKRKLLELAAEHGIDTAKEKAKLAAISSKLRRMARIKVSQYARENGDPGHLLSFLDGDLGKLAKGMCEVSNLSWLIQDLACLVCNVCAEQEWEGDETSPLPGMLEDGLSHMLDTLIAMVAEEAEEMRDHVADRVS